MTLPHDQYDQYSSSNVLQCLMIFIYFIFYILDKGPNTPAAWPTIPCSSHIIMPPLVSMNSDDPHLQWTDDFDVHAHDHDWCDQTIFDYVILMSFQR